MVNENVRSFLYFLESIDTFTDSTILESVKSATNVIFENEIRESKKDYILGIVKFINSDGSINYSLDEDPPFDIEDKIKGYKITTDELIDAKNAYDQFQKIKTELF